ncbi:MAG: hypothetical protein HY788_07645 [Deltaproteobacteria bacterium]|nr:hypothetical protein [Deltaproteobacteria bacterium]
MTVFRYFSPQPNSKKKASSLGADTLLKALSERLLRKYDLASAMDRLKWDGLLDIDEQRVDGLSKMLNQIEELRISLLETYGMDGVLHPLRNDLEAALLEFEATPDPGVSDDGGAAFENASVGPEVAAYEALRMLIVDFPNDLANRMNTILCGSIRDTEVGKRLSERVQDIVGKMSGLQFLVNDAPALAPAELVRSLEDLIRVVDDPGTQDRSRILTFFSQYGHVFDLKGGMGAFLESVQKNRAALRLLVSCLPYKDRLALEACTLEKWGLGDVEIALEALWNQLEQCEPLPKGRQYTFSGSRKIQLDDAFTVAKKLLKLEELEKSIRSSSIDGDLSRINSDLLQDVLGELAESSLDKLAQIIELLERSGYLTEKTGGFMLTAKALRKIGQFALQDTFSQMNLRGWTRRSLRSNRAFHSLSGAVKEYAFGDPWNLDLSSTVLSAMKRNPSGGIPVSISPRDFQLYEPEYNARTSTVLLIDVSSSMVEKLYYAKKVALSLKELISRCFPGDRLHIVGFYTLAKEIRGADLVSLQAMPFQLENHPKSLPYRELRVKEERGEFGFPADFTNIQEGLRVSNDILRREPCSEKHIFLITDGEPTACVMDGVVYLEGQTLPFIVTQTLREVAKCTRNDVRITTFMLSEDEDLREFVAAMGRKNKGKAFFSASETLAQYVVVDYLKQKKYAVD